MKFPALVPCTSLMEGSCHHVTLLLMAHGEMQLCCYGFSPPPPFFPFFILNVSSSRAIPAFWGFFCSQLCVCKTRLNFAGLHLFIGKEALFLCNLTVLETAALRAVYESAVHISISNRRRGPKLQQRLIFKLNLLSVFCPVCHHTICFF